MIIIPDCPDSERHPGQICSGCPQNTITFSDLHKEFIKNTVTNKLTLIIKSYPLIVQNQQPSF